MNKIEHINTAFLQSFEYKLDPSEFHAKNESFEVLGYGEISTVFGINLPGGSSFAFKRLPLFSSMQEAENYGALYCNYNQLLENAGLQVPIFGSVAVEGHSGIHVAYLAQQRLSENSICNQIIRNHTDKEALLLIEKIAKEACKIWTHNSTAEETALGLDAQISNWAVKDYIPGETIISDETELWFIDTSTPFIRINGKEQMNAELLLLSAPGLIRPLLKKFFLQDILDRYYDLRLVFIDLIANLYKEQRADLIPEALKRINRIFSNSSEFKQLTPITEKEIKKYYKEDKFIWQLFINVRRLDRFIRTKIRRQRYEFLLPGKIKR